MKKCLCLFLFGWLAISVFAEEPDWKRTGPVAGTILQIQPDRTHPGVWYLLEQRDGRLYRSIDNGLSWENTRMTNVERFMVDSASSEVFIVRPGRNYNTELLASADLGRTFQLRSGNAPDRIFDHPTDPNILWGSGVEWGYDLSVSFDRGAHWQGFTNLPYKLGKTYNIHGEDLPLDSYYLKSVMVSPLDSKTIYVSTEADFTLGCGGDSVDLELVSTNFGKTWAHSEVPLSSYFYDAAFPDRAFAVSYDELRVLTQRGWRSLAPRHFENIVSVPGKPNKLFALNGEKQYVSPDGGASWRNVDIGPGGKANVLQARTDPEGTLLAGTTGGGVYIIDETWNWHQVTDGLHEATISGVATAPGSPVVFAVTGYQNRFLFRSLNSGKTWKNITDNLAIKPSSYSYARVFVNQRNGKNVFFLADGRINISLDAGETWVASAEKSVGDLFFSFDHTAVYASKGYNGHLYKSTDGALTFRQLPAAFASIYDAAVDRYNGYLYVATSRGLFVSRNDGATAEQLATDLNPDCLTCMEFDQIVPLPQRGQYLTVTEKGLYKSVNQGVTWQKLSEKSGDVYVADENGRHLFMNTDNLLESTDGGKNWLNVSSALDSHLASGSAYVIAMTDPRFRPLYLATSVGMFRSDK